MDETTIPEGTENIQDQEVTQDVTPEEQPSADNGQQAEPQGEANKGFSGKIPYERFQQVNTQKNTLKTENEQLKQALQSLTGGEKPQESGPQEPQREQFQSEADYYRALGVWGGQQGYQQAKQQDYQQTQALEQQNAKNKAQVNYTSKMMEAKGKYNDFDAIISQCTADFTANPALEMAIMSHPQAGDLAYQLGSDPQEAMRISQLPTEQALIALGTLTAKIPGSNGQPIKKSGMPKPIEPVGTAKPTGAKDYSDDMTQEEFDEAYPTIW